jgi:hypothetical protein
MNAGYSPPDFHVAQKAQAVLDYTREGAQPGKPLDILVGGAIVALVAMAMTIAFAYKTLYSGEIDADWGYAGIGVLFAIYTLGLFLFSYGYELYDTGKALRLTLILAFVSLIALVLIIAVLAALSKFKDVSTGSHNPSLSSDSAHPLFHVIGSMVSGDENEAPVEEEDTGLFVIHCQGCGERFIPLPPLAVCPGCGRAALSSS